MAEITPKEKEKEKGSEALVVATQAIAGIITKLIETFGWSGTLLIMGFMFVVYYATPEQKQRIIDMYVLGVGISGNWALVVLSSVFVLTASAQHWWYRKQLKSVVDELERVGEEKSKLQEKKVRKKLPHAKTKTKVGGN